MNDLNVRRRLISCVPVLVEVHNLKDEFSQLQLSKFLVCSVAGFIFSATSIVALLSSFFSLS